MNHPPFKHISVIGAGLIGASILRSVRKNLPSVYLSTYDINNENLEIIANDSLVDIIYKNIEHSANADFIIICTPASKVVNIISKIVNHLKPGTVITDVSSVKKNILVEISSILNNTNYYISSHPMAGGSSQGASESNANLFENRGCILIPINSPPNEIIDSVNSFWKSLGANIGETNADHHDMAVALTSHIPHLLAFSMIELLGHSSNGSINNIFVGRSVLEFIRLGSANPVVWKDIMYMNRTEILKRLTILQSVLQKWKESLSSNSELATSLQIQKITSIRNHHDFFLPGENHD